MQSRWLPTSNCSTRQSGQTTLQSPSSECFGAWVNVHSRARAIGIKMKCALLLCFSMLNTRFFLCTALCTARRTAPRSQTSSMPPLPSLLRGEAHVRRPLSLGTGLRGLFTLVGWLVGWSIAKEEHGARGSFGARRTRWLMQRFMLCCIYARCVFCACFAGLGTGRETRMKSAIPILHTCA
jgi:hypothetical protein